MWASNWPIAGRKQALPYNKDMYFSLQFFDHPVIIDFVRSNWRGNFSQDNDISTAERVFFSVCLVLDVFIFPLIYLLTRVVGNIFYSIRFHKDSLSLGSIPRQAYIFRFLYSTVLVVHSSAKIMFTSISISPKFKIWLFLIYFNCPWM